MIALWSRNLNNGWTRIHEINGIGFEIKTATVPRHSARKLVDAY
jgi:hypothetical protein